MLFGLQLTTVQLTSGLDIPTMRYLLKESDFEVLDNSGMQLGKVIRMQLIVLSKESTQRDASFEL